MVVGLNLRRAIRFAIFFQRFKQKLIATGGFAVQKCEDKRNWYTFANPAYNIQVVERSGQHLNGTPSNRIWQFQIVSRDKSLTKIIADY